MSGLEGLEGAVERRIVDLQEQRRMTHNLGLSTPVATLEIHGLEVVASGIHLLQRFINSHGAEQ